MLQTHSIIVSGIMRHLRQNCGRPDIDFFSDHEFADFRASLDAEMKRLQSAGVGSVLEKSCCGRKNC